MNFILKSMEDFKIQALEDINAELDMGTYPDANKLASEMYVYGITLLHMSDVHFYHRIHNGNEEHCRVNYRGRVGANVKHNSENL
jgi:hypothetical protein